MKWRKVQLVIFFSFFHFPIVVTFKTKSEEYNGLGAHDKINFKFIGLLKTLKKIMTS